MSNSEAAPAMTPEQVEARLGEIAPYPEWGRKVTAEGLARYLAVCAQLGWARNLTPFVPDDMLFPASLVTTQFAAAHALAAMAEADPERADRTAEEITEAWNDGGGVGEWLWEHLTRFGVSPAEVSALDETRIALEKAQRGEPELVRLRRATQMLAKIIAGNARAMEAARIEMKQGSPEKAMQWILNSLPDVWDGPEGTAWDGRETAQEWFDRTEGAYQVAAS